jgi:uncharacterized coiled-coil protein SlyX
MAIDKLSKSNRLLQSRRYTHDSYTDSQEAFTSTLDINANEVYVDQSLIPSTGLPFSGSAQSGSIYSVGGQNIMQYYYRAGLTRSDLVTGSKSEVWFLLSNSSASAAGIGGQLIDGNQQTNFISPKYGAVALTNANAEDATPGYGVKVFVSSASTTAGVTAGDQVSVNNYTFDYKTGVLQFTTTALAPTTSQYVYLSGYQYKGRVLTDNITSVSSSIAAINASLGGGGSLGTRVSNLETTSASVNISISNINSFTASNGNTSLNAATASFAPRITNLETTSASVNISVSNLNTYSASVSNSISNINAFSASENTKSSTLATYTGSIDTKFVSVAASTSSLNSFTSSAAPRLTNLETTSASVNISITNLNSYSASVSNSILNLNAFSASQITKDLTLATYTGSIDTKFTSIGVSTSSLNSFTSSILTALTASGVNLTANGNLTVQGNLTVGGTQTIVNSTTVQLGDNILELNGTGVANGGIYIKDPTAPNTGTGSFLWNSTNDFWIAGLSGSEQRILVVGSMGVVSGSAQISLAGTSDYTSLFTGIASATASLNSFSASNSNTSLNTYTSSVSDPKFVQIAASTASLNSYTASAESKFLAISTFSGSLSSTSQVTFGEVTSSFNIAAASVSGSSTTKRIAFRDTTGKLELVPSASVDGDFVQWNGTDFIMSNIVDGGAF